jgi:hypothetical protein
MSRRDAGGPTKIAYLQLASSVVLVGGIAIVILDRNG